MKNQIYLEPRSTWDSALIDSVNVVYSFTKIIDILIAEMGYTQAFEYFCHEILPLEDYGLQILDDELEKVK